MRIREKWSGTVRMGERRKEGERENLIDLS